MESDFSVRTTPFQATPVSPARPAARSTSMPPPTMDWNARARPLRSEARSSCQDEDTSSSNLVLETAEQRAKDYAAWMNSRA